VRRSKQFPSLGIYLTFCWRGGTSEFAIKSHVRWVMDVNEYRFEQVRTGSNPFLFSYFKVNLELDFRFGSVHRAPLDRTFGPVLISSGSNRSSEPNLPITTFISSDCADLYPQHLQPPLLSHDGHLFFLVHFVSVPMTTAQIYSNVGMAYHWSTSSQ
jgi:hypothetical protein